MNRLRPILALLVAHVAASPVLAAEPAVGFDGRVATGYYLEGWERGFARSELELEVKSKRRDGWRGAAEIRGRTDKPEVKLREAFADYKGDGIRARIGQAKKVLGLEYERGHSERVAPERGVIYRKLETLAYVGRETVGQLTFGDEDATAHGIGLGYAESRDADLIYSYRSRLTKADHIGLWTLAQADRIEEKEQFVWATVLSYWHERDDFWAACELFAGKDAFESFYETLYGSGRAVHFVALKTELALALLPWQPFVQLSGIAHDLRTPRHNTAQAMLGLNYWRGRLRVSVMAEAVGTASRVKPYERAYDESLATVQATVYF